VLDSVVQLFCSFHCSRGSDFSSSSAQVLFKKVNKFKLIKFFFSLALACERQFCGGSGGEGVLHIRNRFPPSHGSGQLIEREASEKKKSKNSNSRVRRKFDLLLQEKSCWAMGGYPPPPQDFQKGWVEYFLPGLLPCVD
jgi:hypothetical protein